MEFLQENHGEAFDLIIVGSGPSGAVAALKAGELGKKVLLITTGADNSSSEISEENVIANVYERTRNKNFLINAVKALAYNSPKTDIKSKFSQKLTLGGNSSSNKLVASSIGGFSEVWGAVVAPLPEFILKRWGEDTDMKASQRYVLDNLPLIGDYAGFEDWIPYIDTGDFSKLNAGTDFQKRFQHFSHKNIRVHKSVLAVHSTGNNACFECGFCMHGCTNDAIWSARHLIKVTKNFNIKIVNGYMAEKIICKNDKVIIECSVTNSSEIIQLEAPKVVLAAGPIGTGKILINSIPDLKSIKFSDSSVVYGLHFMKRDSRKNRIRSLSEISAYLRNQNLVDAYLQFYTLDESIVNSFFKESNFSNLIASKFLIFFKKYFVISLIYLPASDSTTIILRENNELSFETKSFHSRLFAYYSRLLKYSKLFSTGKILLFPIGFRFHKKGEGMHFGSGIGDLDGQSIDFRFGKYRDFKYFENLYLVDAIALPEIVVGPPTLAIMAHVVKAMELIWNETE